MQKRKAKNNNLSKHKEELAIKNKSLVQKAISHIVALSGEITFSSVSKVTYEVADIQSKQKGLTLAAISKSPVYRALVEEAKANQHIKEKGRTVNVGSYSKGDLGLMMHSLRVENVTLRQDKKILSLKLKEVSNDIGVVEPIRDSIIKKGNALQDISRSLVNRLCELELTYIDAEKFDLKVSGFEYVVLQKEALSLFYEKELNDIKSKIRGNTTSGKYK